MNYNDFFAKDIYPKWKEYVKIAEESIVVVSPYVDNTVKVLLTNPQIRNDVEISIVTRVDADTVFHKPYQIRALINCARKNIAVFHLEDLHAKMLIIDNKYLSIGSQNFTSRGKRNREVSMISLNTFAETAFLNQILLWIEDSQELDLEYLVELEIGLKKFRPRIESLRKEHKLEFDHLSYCYFELRKLELLAEIEKQRSNSRIRFASEYVYLSMTAVTSNDSYMSTLLADSQYDLQRWKEEDGGSECETLVRLKYYPMLNLENSALAFGRIASTRISSVLRRYGFSDKYIDGYLFRISIVCPEKDTHRVNVEFQFKFYERNGNQYYSKLGYYYNGSKCTRIEEEFSSAKGKAVISKLFLRTKELEESFLKEHFRGADLSTIGSSISGFLEGRRYKLFIVQFLSNPILVCDKQW